MKKVILPIASLFTALMVSLPAQSARMPSSIVDVVGQKPSIQTTMLEGYVIGEPQYLKAENAWRFKFAPKRNKDLEGLYLVVTVPAGKGRDRQTYYLGDYVKLKASADVLKTAQTQSKRGVANDAAGS